MYSTASFNDIQSIINAEHHDPFSVLGMHSITAAGKTNGNSISSTACTADDSVSNTVLRNAGTGAPVNSCGNISVRSFIPGAASVDLIDDITGNEYGMQRTHESGFFEVALEDRIDFFTYKLKITYASGDTLIQYDPYSFLPVISEFDLYLFNEGNHHKVYEKLGAHICTINGIKGTLFSVWAPCAKRVSVVGSFNQWDGRRHQMRILGCSGVWEIFIPGVNSQELYKFEIKLSNNELYVKSDPYAFYSELRPGTASIVYDVDNYVWNDSDWIKERDSSSTLDRPVSIYEVHLGSWARKPEEGHRFLTYRELGDKLVNYVKELGYTHIELMPVAEYPFDGSWGYQITGYYSVTSRYGSPEDFCFFIDKCHQNGIGVIMDWVPAHFPKDGHGLARFDGTALYEHYDPKQGEHPDWGTHIFNYGRHEVRNFLISNAVFWLEKYHIDGLRVDAVASMLYLDYAKKNGEWMPNRWGGKENVDAIEFMRQLNSTVFRYFPGAMMIAEESTSWALVSKPAYVGGLGFSYKWNMGWMNDYIRYVSMDSIYRKYHHNTLTFSIMYAFTENFILVLSHDEVVHGKCSMINKMPGFYPQKFAGLRASYGYMYGHPGKKLLFMGGEFAQFIEWDYKRSLDWHLLDYEMHRKLLKFIKDLNLFYRKEKALYENDFSHNGFEWIDCSDADHSIVSFIRKGKEWREILIFVCNFTPVVYRGYFIGAPFDVYYEEVLNSDSEIYGGSNTGNFGGVHAEKIPFHNRPYSLKLNIPALGVLVLKPVFDEHPS